MHVPVTAFSDLAWFLAVANEGSFALAAKRLGADASTVSRRIQRLESRTGRTLFHRSARGTELSEAGVLLAERVQSAMNLISLGLEELADTSTTLAGIVRVAAPTEVGSSFFIPQLPELQALHPDIVVELELGTDYVDLDKREADIALRSVRPQTGDIVTRRVGSLRVAPFHSPSLSPTVAAQQWMTWMEDDPYVAGLRTRRPDLRVTFRSNDLAGLRAACIAGLGTALLPLQLGRAHGLCQLAGTEAFVGPPLWMAAPKTSLERPRVRAVWDFVLDRFQQLTEADR